MLKLNTKSSLNMQINTDTKFRDCQYFFDGFWQPCKLIDFYNVAHVGMIYSIEFQGELFSVFDREVRFLNFKNEQLATPFLTKKSMDSKVVFH